MTAIDQFVRSLDRSLAGPARLKTDLLTEARDGLADAAAAYRETGLPAAEAEGRAVRDFGTLPALAPAYQAELVAAAAQRLALLLALIPMAVAALSDLMWRGAPWTDVPPSAGYQLLSVGIDRFGTALALTALTGYGWLVLRARRGRSIAPTVARRVAQAGFGGVAALWVAGLTIFALTVSRTPAALTWPPMIIGGLLITGALGWLARRAWRCATWAAPTTS